ncbi:endonuclease/exonuclease/phosphatase family protein [uncultured Cytophaga sp.]|uniref:endonuclease/exonuclease/phosphatase family protein n=1 Tax=uncultured Cytophaga sp. TaxID=160238 RepID=UPI00261189F0|nr:endonuclease/exonuclease/phosphatase family protein [uncultured Cytophaga sp.]
MTNQRTYKGAILLTVMSLGLYFMPDISPRSFWYSSFISLFIPAGLIVVICALVYWGIKRDYLFFLAFILLVINWKFVQRSITISSESEKEQEFSILSYNARLFNVYPQFADKTFSATRKMIDFIKKSDIDVVCIQEFYNDPKDTLFNTVHRIKKKYPYYYFSTTFKNHTGGMFGMVIFSKYPIISKGTVVFNEGSNNQTIYADIDFPTGKARVYNMHLQSMSINDKEIAESHFDQKSKTKVMQAFLKYKSGTINRSIQVDKLVNHIKDSPYKPIVCGDLNDPPYSYTYEKLSDVLNNGFEKKGNGFGFTFNGKIPFLRIDHQFSDPNIIVTRFETKTSVSFTDHFPIIAGYRFK